MKQKDFNEKYCNYIKDGFRGLDLINETAIDYLDKKFQEYIKIPEFKYLQIKSKWNWYCFYAEGISMEEREEVELNLKKICSF